MRCCGRRPAPSPPGSLRLWGRNGIVRRAPQDHGHHARDHTLQGFLAPLQGTRQGNRWAGAIVAGYGGGGVVFVRRIVRVE